MLESSSPTEHNKLAVTLGTYGYTNHASISISHGSLKSAATLTFERTLRVPDNKDVNNLPPSLGQFPLFSVADYKDRMPDEMAKKGGVFLPMYQREAMWIKFSAREPFALKVYVGGVNAISGVPMNETPEATLERLKISDKVKQDYVVLPDQPWLDGIASEDGHIRQFVAMPKGSGYSVEVQVTGEEKIDGMQFELTPVKRRCPEHLKVSLLEGGFHWSPSPIKEKVLNLHEKRLGDLSTMLDLKKIIEEEFGVSVPHQMLSLQSSDYPGGSTDLNDESATFSDVWISESSSIQIRDNSAQEDEGRLHERSIRSTGSALYGAAQSLSAPSFAAKKKNGVKSEKIAGAESAGIAVGAVASSMAYQQDPSQLSRRRRTGSGILNTPGSAAMPAPPPQVQAMSLAAGGLIKQSINADNYPASIWDSSSSILFNVQLLNSESFIAVTGRAPPSSPIDAKTYKQYNYPFYDIWNEELSGVKGNFDAVKSVGEIDEGLAVSEKKTFWENLTGGGGNGGQMKEDKPFKRDESLLFPVIMLDMNHKRTFKPLKEIEEEVRKSKADAR